MTIADAATASLPTSWPDDVKTLAIDIGGTGLKASVLDAAGKMTVDRVRTETPYPCPPELLVTRLLELVKPLPEFHRVSVGFPGLIRRRQGRDGAVPFAGRPGRAAAPRHGRCLVGLSAGDATAARHSPSRCCWPTTRTCRAARSSRARASSSCSPSGTGLGCALFQDGELLPHLELPHGPFRQGQSFEEQLGQAARKAVGPERWNRRLQKALDEFNLMVRYDHVYIGGGNARKVTADLGPKATVVDNTAGILGGIKLWERHGAVRRP